MAGVLRVVQGRTAQELEYLTEESRVMQIMEARVGIEPTHKGFADLSLTTWVPRLEPCCRRCRSKELRRRVLPAGKGLMERETGVEPATSSLARKHSTTELLPLVRLEYSERAGRGQRGACDAVLRASRPLRVFSEVT